MKKEIKNITDLRNQVNTLKALREPQRELIKNDLLAIKDDLRPAKVLQSLVESTVGNNTMKAIVKLGLNFFRRKKP